MQNVSYHVFSKSKNIFDTKQKVWVTVTSHMVKLFSPLGEKIWYKIIPVFATESVIKQRVNI